MYEQCECIFCFELLEDKSISRDITLVESKLKFYIKNVRCINLQSNFEMYEKFVEELSSYTFTLKCGHVYHCKCLLTFINMYYNQNICCPLCRGDIAETDLVEIISYLNPLITIKELLDIDFSKLKRRILYKKIVLYTKKTLFLNINRKEVFEYFILKELVESYKTLNKILDKTTRVLHVNYTLI